MNTQHFFLKAAIMLTFICGIFTSASFAQNQDQYISAITGKNLVIKTNNTERMRITSDGQIGVGVSAPTEKFEILGNLKVNGFISADSINTQKSQTNVQKFFYDIVC